MFSQISPVYPQLFSIISAAAGQNTSPNAITIPPIIENGKRMKSNKEIQQFSWLQINSHVNPVAPRNIEAMNNKAKGKIVMMNFPINIKRNRGNKRKIFTSTEQNIPQQSSGSQQTQH